MSHPEQKKLTVYADNAPDRGEYDRTSGELAVPATYVGLHCKKLRGDSWPVERIQYPPNVGGHVLFLLSVQGSEGPMAENYVRAVDVPEDAFTPDENHSNTPAAEG